MTEEGDWAEDPLGRPRVKWRAEKNEWEWQEEESNLKPWGESN